MSDTPLTDAAIQQFEYTEIWLGGESWEAVKEIIDPEFARQLERRVIALERKCADLQAQRDALLEPPPVKDPNQLELLP